MSLEAVCQTSNRTRTRDVNDACELHRRCSFVHGVRVAAREHSCLGRVSITGTDTSPSLTSLPQRAHTTHERSTGRHLLAQPMSAGCDRQCCRCQCAHLVPWCARINQERRAPQRQPGPTLCVGAHQGGRSGVRVLGRLGAGVPPPGTTQTSTGAFAMSRA